VLMSRVKPDTPIVELAYQKRRDGQILERLPAWC